MHRIVSTSVNGVKTFHVTAEKALPDHFGPRANRRIGKHAELRNGVSLIQEFDFTGSSRLLKLSSDALTLAVSGEYPPQIKVFDLQELTQTTVYMTRKLPSHFDFLTENWDKTAVLRSDRKLDFYDRGGLYHSQPLPIRCRHFFYNSGTADIVLGSEDSQLLRLNLEYGRFMESIPTCSQVANVVAHSAANQLIVVGYEDGELEFFDPRDKRSLAAVTLQSEVTALVFDGSGMNLAAGVSSGDVALFDIRSSRPLLSYGHRNQSPVHSLAFHESRKLVSGDRKGCRIYDLDSRKFFTSFETRASMTSFLLFPGSGLLFAGVEAESVQVMVIPELGPAPRAFSFLDNLIYDVEAADQEVTPLYEDQKFVTRDEVEQFGMEHLLGVSVLRPYMHGFFVPRELYRMIKEKGEAPGYEEWQKRVRSAREVERERGMVVQRRKAPKRTDEEEPATKRQKKKLAAVERDSYYQD
jgi:ribosome biogenesis protein ENP2